MSKKQMISIICVFLAIIIIPSGISIAKGQTKHSVKENRDLQTRPSISFSSLMDGTFQDEYENYLSDQFVLRDYFVAAKTKAFMLIGKKDINNVYIGSNGYLFEKYTSSDFDDAAVNNNINYLTQFLNNCSNNYDSVSVVFIPSKANVLTNYMPKYATAYNTDYVYNSIKNKVNGNVNALYLKDTLSSHNDEYIYYKSDHHWTTLGAYYGYSNYRQSLNLTTAPLNSYNKKVVTKSFLGTDYDKLQMDSTADYITQYNGGAKITVNYNGEKDSTNTVYVDGNLKVKDKYTYFFGGNYKKINIKTNVNNGKKLLLIKDSFSNSMVPFMLNDYSEIVMVDLRYYTKNISTVLNEEQGITDILVMYNTEKFMMDSHQFRLTK